MSSLKRLAWIFGCAKKGSPEEAQRRKALLEFARKPKPFVPYPERTPASTWDLSDEGERSECERYQRWRDEWEAWANVDDLEVARKRLAAVGQAVWGSLADIHAVPKGLCAADVVRKYIQRGNIERDGEW